MSLNLNQQVQEAMGRAKQVLIAFRQNGGGDAVAAALALAKVLKKQGKQTESASDDFSPSSSLNFLPEIKEIKSQLSPLQKFIVKIDISKNKLESLSYDVKDDLLYVYITPRQGLINHEDVKTVSTDLKFDLIFVLDSPDLESLGRIYDNNTDLFFKTPVINIDHDPANEHFGKINLVDLSAASTSEIIFEFLNQTMPDQINEEIATLLLTGLIVKTKNFKTPGVNARTLDNAGKLMDLGAQREKIVQNLFRNRSLATLKLWGLALTHLKNDPSWGGAWLTLSREDFRQAGTNEEYLPEIIDELLSNAPEAKIIALLYETEKHLAGQLTKQVEGIVVSTRPQPDIKLLTKTLHPEGTTQQVKIIFKDKDLVAAEAEIVDLFKKTTSNKKENPA